MAEEKHCKHCPNKGIRPCEKWVDIDWGLLETNIATGEERFMTGCFYHVQFRMMRHVVTAANRGAETSQKASQQILRGIGEFAGQMDNVMERYLEHDDRVPNHQAELPAPDN